MIMLIYCPQEVRTTAINRPLEINEIERGLKGSTKAVEVSILSFAPYFTYSWQGVQNVNSKTSRYVTQHKQMRRMSANTILN